jgi:hypothetical protein
MQTRGRQPEEVRVHELKTRAPGILIAADGAGGNGSRLRLWQTELQRNRRDALCFPALGCSKTWGTACGRTERRVREVITRTKMPSSSTSMLKYKGQASDFSGYEEEEKLVGDFKNASGE